MNHRKAAADVLVAVIYQARVGYIHVSREIADAGDGAVLKRARQLQASGTLGSGQIVGVVINPISQRTDVAHAH